MISWSTDSPAAAQPRLGVVDWSVLLLLVVLASAVRVVFFSGLMGSDDAVYTAQALAILHGKWSTSSTYVGALRYGINLPMAGFMGLFGLSEFTANLWSLVCSLGELAVVFLLARYLWGLRAAVLASLVLGLLPLHVNLSGRLLADSPLAFFITLCFATFYFAERDRDRWLYLAAGLSLGAVYWVKESVAPLIVPTFLLYAIITRTFRRDWLWAVSGAALLVVLNTAFMWWIAGDPLLVFHAMGRGIEAGATWEGLNTSPAYYSYYLFLDIRHTWLMPFLAVACLAWWGAGRDRNADTGYIILWGAGLLATLSFAAVSVSPLRFIWKQTNYMLVFAAPLALLAGYQLAQMRGKWLASVLFLVISGSLVLSALEQQAVRVFVANSRGAVAFAAAHPRTPVYGTSYASSLSWALSELGGQWRGQPSIRPVDELPTVRGAVPGAVTAKAETEPAAYVVLDMETAGRRRGELHLSPQSVPSCWRYTGTIEPEGFGVGKIVLGAPRRVAEMFLPERLAKKALSATEWLYRPQPAYVYAVPAGCAFLPQTNRSYRNQATDHKSDFSGIDGSK